MWVGGWVCVCVCAWIRERKPYGFNLWQAKISARNYWIEPGGKYLLCWIVLWPYIAAWIPPSSCPTHFLLWPQPFWMCSRPLNFLLGWAHSKSHPTSHYHLAMSTYIVLPSPPHCTAIIISACCTLVSVPHTLRNVCMLIHVTGAGLVLEFIRKQALEIARMHSLQHEKCTECSICYIPASRIQHTIIIIIIIIMPEPHAVVHFHCSISWYIGHLSSVIWQKWVDSDLEQDQLFPVLLWKLQPIMLISIRIIYRAIAITVYDPAHDNKICQHNSAFGCMHDWNVPWSIITAKLKEGHDANPMVKYDFYHAIHSHVVWSP